MDTVISESLMEIDPNNDGIDHVNIYSRSKCELGRLLSNFAHTPIEHPRYGKFESIEGFWYWLSTGACHDRLKELWGHEAKKYGKTLARVEYVGTERTFEAEIEQALRLKVHQNPQVLKLILTNVLPYQHYYCWEGTKAESKGKFKVIRTSTGDWLAEAYTRIQESLPNSGWSDIL